MPKDADKDRYRRYDPYATRHSPRPTYAQQLAEQRERDRITHEAQLAEAQALLLEILARPPAPKGRCGDGSFYATFVPVGQGDCIVMSTPGGQTVLIDCGTNAHEEDRAIFRDRVSGLLTDARYLEHTKLIDIVILTHPDGDHYNELVHVLDVTEFRVGRIYHSAQIGLFGDAFGWSEKVIKDRKMTRAVVNNRDKVGSKTIGDITLGGFPVRTATGANRVDCLDEQGGIIIVNEPACRVTILASDVQYQYHNDHDSAGRNRGSVVTLVEVFGKRLLLLGDATTNTEDLLLRRYGDRIKEVDVVQVAHHGSDETSTSPEWVARVAPKDRAVASAGKEGHKAHRLPRWPILDLYDEHFRAIGRTVPPNTTWAWDVTTNMYKNRKKTLTTPIYVTGSYGPVDIHWTNP